MNMKNQMIIIINDKETLAKIAEEPDTELRIKNSLVDSIVKRVEKKCSSTIEELVSSQSLSALVELNLINKATLYTTVSAGPRLREVVKDAVKDTVKKVMDDEIHGLICEEVKMRMDDVAKMISDKVNEEIKSYNTTDENIARLVKEAVNRYVERRLQIKSV